MEKDFKKEAKRQYLHHFRFWFVGIGILAAVCAVLGVVRRGGKEVPRTNLNAPAERVYDYADILTDQEEENLRRHIAETEKSLGIDIVLVTIDYSVEGKEAMEQHGLQSADWERNMRDIADDFWDRNQYGYNKGFEGDGVLLLHNWYPGQNGEHLSTSGKVERAFSMGDINRVLDAVDAYYDTNPYKAYKAYIDEVKRLMGGALPSIPWAVVIFGPVVVAAVYGVGNLNQRKAEKTTGVNTYVAGGKPQLKDSTDTFIRKSVVTRIIETGGGSARSGGGGGGGHHYSRSGASHGGGSRRH